MAAELELSAGALPYDDGSGFQVSASVKRTGEGLMLRFDVVHNIKIGDWPAVKRMIDALVESADKVATAQGR
jgi:hypothetical protein